MDQIIKSNLEQDLYKDSMGQAIFHQFNGYMTEWTFKSRNKDVIYSPEVVGEIARQIELYCKLRYTKDELDWIVKTFPWIHKDYVNCFLRLFQPDPSEIFINGVCLALGADKIPSTDYGCGLSIEFMGPWLTTSRYEVPVLAIVNEVYFAKKYGEGKDAPTKSEKIVADDLQAKIEKELEETYHVPVKDIKNEKGEE